MPYGTLSAGSSFLMFCPPPSSSPKRREGGEEGHGLPALRETRHTKRTFRGENTAQPGRCVCCSNGHRKRFLQTTAGLCPLQSDRCLTFPHMAILRCECSWRQRRLPVAASWSYAIQLNEPTWYKSWTIDCVGSCLRGPRVSFLLALSPCQDKLNES